LKDSHDKLKILITGAGGQLGQELQVASSKYPQFEFHFFTKAKLPVDDADSVSDHFSIIDPTICINAAAYTAVDKAEQEKEVAFRINGEAVGIIAKACAKQNAWLIHISTDYVFDGNSSIPLKEDDFVSPVNTYGESKLKGEQLAFSNNEKTIIIRTSWVYSEFGNNFVKTMMRLMKEKDQINVIDDQYGSPTYAADLSEAILQILRNKNLVSGIYNYSNEGKITWYEFAQGIKELIGSSCKINPIPTVQYPTPAKRPHFSLLDKNKIMETYKIQMIPWRDSLKRCIDRIIK
jgi:dTDP-4-dehydrorhamnose reductase